MWTAVRQRFPAARLTSLEHPTLPVQQLEGRRPRSNTVPRSIDFLGFTLTDEQRRIAYNTLIIVSISLSCLLALVGAYFGIYREIGGNPWIVAFPSILSSGLVVLTYAWGGLLRHGESYGWAFFQPGRGGRQFVTLQAASWTCVAVSLVIPWLPWLLAEMLNFPSGWPPKQSPRHSAALLVVSSGIAVIGQLLTVTSLFAFKRPSQKFAWRFLLTERADGKAFLYFFMSVQTGLAVYAVVVLFMTDHFEDLIVGSAATLAFIWLIAVSTSLTHGVGGPWLKGEEGFTAFQPGRGGTPFILMQFLGWSLTAVSIFISICRIVCMLELQSHPIVCFFASGMIPDGAWALGILGLLSQLLLSMSLFVFEEGELQKARRFYRTKRVNEKNAWLSCFTGLPPEVKRQVLDYL